MVGDEGSAFRLGHVQNGAAHQCQRYTAGNRGMISIDILGPPVFKMDGRPVKIPRKAGAVLGFLAVQGKGVRVERAKLADLLWPCQGTEQSRHSLRNSLLELRKAIGRDAIGSDFVYCWLSEVVRSDVERFNALAGSGNLIDLEGARGLWRGELFDLSWSAGEVWAEWLHFERMRLTDIFRKLLTTLCSAGHRDQQITLGTARQLTRLDALDEEASRVLMRSLWRSGLRRVALQHFAELKRLLRAELGVEPEAQTSALASEIARSRSPTAEQQESPTSDQDACLAYLAASDPERGAGHAITQFEAQQIALRLARLTEAFTTALLPGEKLKRSQAIEAREAMNHAAWLLAEISGSVPAAHCSSPREHNGSSWTSYRQTAVL